MTLEVKRFKVISPANPIGLATSLATSLNRHPGSGYLAPGRKGAGCRSGFGNAARHLPRCPFTGQLDARERLEGNKGELG